MQALRRGRTVGIPVRVEIAIYSCVYLRPGANLEAANHLLDMNEHIHAPRHNSTNKSNGLWRGETYRLLCLHEHIGARIANASPQEYRDDNGDAIGSQSSSTHSATIA